MMNEINPQFDKENLGISPAGIMAENEKLLQAHENADRAEEPAKNKGPLLIRTVNQCLEDARKKPTTRMLFSELTPGVSLFSDALTSEMTS